MPKKWTRSKAAARLAELREMLEDPNADVDAIEAEIEEIEQALETLVEAAEDLAEDAEEAAEEERADDDEEEHHDPEEEDRGSQARRRAQLRARMAAGTAGRVIRTFNRQEDTGMTNTYNASSPEYRTAWLKTVAVRNGRQLLGPMNAAEKRAFTFMTSNTEAVVPLEIQNRIIELVESMSPMLEDATASALTKGFGVPRHKSIEAGDAAATQEGVANEDEEDAFDLLELTGVEIKKHVRITRKMEFQSIDAFEDWLVDHLAKRIAVAKEKHIISRLDNTTYGIAAANKLTAQTYDDATIRKIRGLIRGKGVVKVYANRATIWNGLAGITEEDGSKCFIKNSMVDPECEGLLYGAPVRTDENLPDNVAYFLIPASILANNFDNLAVARDTDVTSWVTTIGGYSLFDAGLEDPLAGVKVTFTAN